MLDTFGIGDQGGRFRNEAMLPVDITVHVDMELASGHHCVTSCLVYIDLWMAFGIGQCWQSASLLVDG